MTQGVGNCLPKGHNLHKLGSSLLMQSLHFVPGGHDFGNCGRYGVTVTQRRGTGLTKVTRRGCCGHRDTFSKSKNLPWQPQRDCPTYMCRSRTGRIQQNVTDLNNTWSMSVAGRLVAGRHHKVCQGLSCSVAICHVLPTRPLRSNLNLESRKLR